MTSKGSGLIMSACVGGAVVPYLLGALADRVGIQHALSFQLFVISILPTTACGDQKSARRQH